MTTMILPVYRYLNNRIKRFTNLNKLTLSQSAYHSNRDEFGIHVLAIDLPKRKLLYAKKVAGISSCLTVDLYEVERCTVRKEYNSINAGELTTNNLHHFLKSVILHLVFKNNSRTLSHPLFDARRDQKSNLEQVEAMAKKWQSLVSKILPVRLKERA